jgi:hypothetical protein
MIPPTITAKRPLSAGRGASPAGRAGSWAAAGATGEEGAGRLGPAVGTPVGPADATGEYGAEGKAGGDDAASLAVAAGCAGQAGDGAPYPGAPDAGAAARSAGVDERPRMRNSNSGPNSDILTIEPDFNRVSPTTGL